ncbi:MAG TPA: hypothetical protein VJ553_00300 [Candidatus Paceibacterota bacterium]|nr:hypothetical protein [Candidatus Paceibacterota bacterium]
MMLVTLRTFVETDLGDAPLQAILDAADEDLTAAVGPDLADVEKQDMDGQGFLFLTRPAAAITSITEYSGGVTTTLVAGDYELQPNKKDIRRLSTGTNPAYGWNGTVTVSYTPDDLKKRDRCIVQLVELDLAFRPGAKSENVGDDHSRTMEDYDKARVKIISQARSRAFA